MVGNPQVNLNDQKVLSHYEAFVYDGSPASREMISGCAGDLEALVNDGFYANRDKKVNPAFASWMLHESDVVILVFTNDEDNRLIGCMAGSVGICASHPDMDVKDVVTAREYRGNGVQSLMMNRMEKVARELGLERVVLVTEVDNEPACAAYEHGGFHERVGSRVYVKDL